jgi:histidyl-tRNA synthetase
MGNMEKKEIVWFLKFWIWDFLWKPMLHLENKDSTKLTSSISEKALRYDLSSLCSLCSATSERYWISFKRYQIQPVLCRQTQKGRFREFFQCDADVVGSIFVARSRISTIYDTVFLNWVWKEWPLKLIIEKYYLE